MGKKKKVEVGTFTVVSKLPKGQKSNIIYTVTYQRSGKPEMYTVKMLWLDFREDEPTWAFLDGKEADRLSNEERKEFIKEMPKFQKGGSYRKTHPITYTEKESLRQLIKQKESEIYNIQQEIDKIENEEAKSLVNKYNKLIDCDSLDLFENELRELESKTGYVLKKKNLAYNTDVVVYDTNKLIPVGIVRYYRNNWHIEKLDDYMIRTIIKENPDIKELLKE